MAADEFPTPPRALAEPIPAARVIEALRQPGLAPTSATAWRVGERCLIAVNLQETGGIAYTTAVSVLESSDGGATWRSLGAMDGAFTDRFVTRDGAVWVWSTWEVEGTFSSLYRLDGALVGAPALDEAVRARGGCCFTRIVMAAFADAQRGIVQVEGLEAGLEDPAGAEQGWFGTTDGGLSWVWLGERPTAAWRRLARRSSQHGAAPEACMPPGLG